MKKFLLLFMLFVASASCGFTQEQKFSNLAGRSLSAEEIVAAPKTVLFMWTTWCPYCRKEFARLMKDPITVKDVSSFYVNLGEPQSKIDAYLEGIKAPSSVKEKIIIDGREYFSSKYHVVGIPTYIFLKDGKVVGQENFIDNDTVKSVFANTP
jgi:predicted bacteriocin transport accessory protein